MGHLNHSYTYRIDMALFGNILYIGSILLAVGHLVLVIRKARNHKPIMPIFVSAALVFLLCLVLVRLFGFSPFHVLWIAPASLVLGAVLLFLPPYTKLLVAFLEYLVRLGGPREE